MSALGSDRQGGWRAARTLHCPSLSKTESGQSVREMEDLMEDEGDERQMRGGMSKTEDRWLEGEWEWEWLKEGN
ncbi:hypothetical protein EYF80_032247 [Liparis tanakae]|uniref:Uncharacterized protein n=1 Tax=Liparis tanakae TaxID=230148 RepID=A0A4Z2GXM4_9TELE|nr:hypothetical protein EYF80_032247 [Liparis tanakae]